MAGEVQKAGELGTFPVSPPRERMLFQTLHHTGCQIEQVSPVRRTESLLAAENRR